MTSKRASTPRSPVKSPIPNSASKARADIRAALFGLALVAAFAPLGVAADLPVDKSDDSIRIGSSAPDFSVTTTTGAHFRYTAAGATRPMFLEVFATWCPHCARMAPVISKLYAKYRDRIDVIAATGSPFARDGKSSESNEDVVAWAKKVHAEYPVAFDESGAVAHRYQAHGYPLLVLVDSDGLVQTVGSGEIPFSVLDRRFDAVLAQQKPDP